MAALGLARASSNTPTLVVVCESKRSRQDLMDIFPEIEALLRRHPEVGAFDQAM